MKILIIDDSDYKITALQGLISDLQPGSAIESAKSYQSGMKALQAFQPDLVILDMSLPTSESVDHQLEGRTRMFGGRDILAEMEFRKIMAKVIVVTQFDHFGEPPASVDLKTLLGELKQRFPSRFVGGVYYNNLDARWRRELSRILKQLL